MIIGYSGYAEVWKKNKGYGPSETTTIQDYLKICKLWADNISKKSENRNWLQSLGYIHMNLGSAMHKNKENK